MIQIEDIAGTKVLIVPAEGTPVTTGDDAVALIGEALSVGADMVAIPTARLHADFLTLSSRMAGEVVQKFTNYRLRVAIVGDVSEASARSDALRAFIVESNRGEGLWFVDSAKALAERLGAPG